MSAPLRTVHRRRLVALATVAVVIVAVVIVAVVLVAGQRGRSGPPDEGAAALVPDDTLAFVSVSTDPGRDANRRLLRTLEGFPGFRGLRDGLLARATSAGAAGTRFAHDVRPWLGDEAALALLNTGGTRADSLLVLRVGDRAGAQRFLDRPPVRAVTRPYRGLAVANYGPTATAFVDGYLLVGQDAGVRAAIDRTQGATSLAVDPTYRYAGAGAPAQRSALLYFSAAGLRRLLRPAPGLAGTVGALLDAPDLAGAAVALSGGAPGLRLWAHRTLNPALAPASAPAPRFSPTLDATVPAGALAYVGLAGLDRLGAALGGSRGVLGFLVGRLRVAGSGAVGRQLRASVVPLLRGEVALWLAQAVPAPTLTLVARTGDEARTRAAIAGLQAPLLAAFTPVVGSGQAPALVQRDAAGLPVSSLQLAPGLELNSAVFGGRLVVSTALGGLTAIRQSSASLSGDGGFRTTLADRPADVGTVVYVDFDQLLDLAERTGLGADPRYAAHRADLRRVRSIGGWSISTARDSTTEVRVRLAHGP